MTHRFWRAAAALVGAMALGIGAMAWGGQPLPPAATRKGAASARPARAVVPEPIPAEGSSGDSATSATSTAPGPLPGTVPGLNDAEARRVRREGVVVRPFNIQAPSFYALKARDSGRIINFLMTTRAEPLNWREFRGKVVTVSGREYLDHRPFWNGIPLLNVDTIEAVR